MKYSATTGCFYPEWGKYEDAPADLIDVTENEFNTAINRSPNQRISVVKGKVAIEQIPQRSLVKRQRTAWELIKAERTARYESGVLVDGNWFHTDGYSRIQYLGLKDEVNDAPGIDTDPVVIDAEIVVWKTMADAFIPLTRKLVQDIVKAVKVLDKRLLKAAKIHREAMEASADPEKYDYSAGWPARYGDDV